MCSALMMAIVIQMCVLPMYQSMRNRSVARPPWDGVTSYVKIVPKVPLQQCTSTI